MKALKSAEVKRSGVTANFWTNETKNVSGGAHNGLQFRFNMASKGGGKTDVLLSVSLPDVRDLILEVAGDHPELIDTLAEATHIAAEELSAGRRIK